MFPSSSLFWVSSHYILTIKRGGTSKKKKGQYRRADQSQERRVRAPSAVKDKQLLWELSAAPSLHSLWCFIDSKATTQHTVNTDLTVLVWSSREWNRRWSAGYSEMSKQRNHREMEGWSNIIVLFFIQIHLASLHLHVHTLRLIPLQFLSEVFNVREDRQEMRAQGGQGDMQQAFTETKITMFYFQKKNIAVFPLIHPEQPLQLLPPLHSYCVLN